ncbi:MAG: hypothetical protein ABGY71_08450 [bacterium]|nr:hypothetical protein [Planctomycetota bacterium]HIL52612.1 hypothetical protein [Planctomycetota bacterium]
MTSTPNPPLPPRLPFSGPLLLLFPALFFAGAVQYQRAQRPQPGPPPARPEEPSTNPVAGWLGHGVLVAGGQLRARLLPLHNNRERQSFDADSLARRLELGPGEPWRLELRYLVKEPGGQYKDSAEGSSTRSASLDLSDLVVSDATGRAAGALSGPELAAGEVIDPLWSVLAAPTYLQPGETTRLVLWGRAPKGRASLQGSFAAVALFPEDLTPEQGDSPLAELERRE